jgi:hypothetical protein
MCALAQATMSSTGLLCEFEVGELSCGEDDELLLGTGEAINNVLIRVAVVYRESVKGERSEPRKQIK